MIDFRKRRLDSLGFRVARLFRINGCLLEKKLAGSGLTMGQVPYIQITLEKGGQTQDQLAARACVNRAATARTLKTLEKLDFVVRKENPKNRRQKLVYPTDKAREVLPHLLGILDEHDDMMFNDFSTEEKELLLRLLDRVIGTVKTELGSCGKESCYER
ncbi:MarR family winged helix-turn-helix transcriptional regulator [Pseudodesulfovibrio piezophilus]|uniref:Putative Transcriptional regulator, MarR family n=1 Tax=Pseudodesulfovibrio piezophilus (strain DSM 21447 / JCM 15486 / C1TLV30) TaxID=1322246 RepID=M1WV89_PSEP2|nr:MarR family transcriptional regulator [Pseudodesulfovibrio piezophilus]CCH48248.1 putative Transcriptional regulator, MarR family [Pseudodesulfovibrio piezophilus C1TLV30]